MTRASPSDKGRTPSPSPSRLFLVLSHLVVMAIAFHVGTIYGMGAVESSTVAGGLSFNCDLNGGGGDHEILRMHRRSKDTTRSRSSSIQQDNVPLGVSEEGGEWAAQHWDATLLSRSFFYETFDLGLPWDNDDRGSKAATTSSNKRSKGNDEDEKNILLLLPPSVDAKHLVVKSFSDTMMDRQDLSNACDVVKVVITGSTDRRELPSHKESENNPHPPPENHKVCVAVVRDSPWESYHVHKFMQKKNNNHNKNNIDVERWHQVSRFAGTDALLQNPPKPVSVNESLRLLQQYWEIHETVLAELRPLVENVATASSTQQHRIRDGWPENTIVVMVCNAGHATLLLNFVCAAQVAHVDLSTVLLFATDATTAQLARELHLAYYYNEKLFASVPSQGTVEYGTMAYAQVMMAAKVYSVHLISTLGFDFIFQDVDVVPYRSDYLTHFMNLANSGESGKELDLFFQYDHSTQPQYQPWSANSGFYYARNNVRTRYFFSALLRSGDLILRSKSHQAVMNLWLSEHASLFGLRVGVMNAQQSRQYPVGYHFHQDRAFMKDMIRGQIEKPYAFHMNWNNDKETKRKFNQQLGDWYVDDEGNDESCGAANSVDQLVQSVASSAQQCCVIDPVIVCHYRDKPSKIPCESSPLIEDETSFW